VPLNFKLNQTTPLDPSPLSEDPTLTEDIDVLSARVHAFLRKHLPLADANEILFQASRILDIPSRTTFLSDAVLMVSSRVLKQQVGEVADIQYRWKPVGVVEFLTSPDYLNKAEEIYPEVLKCAEELNSGGYVEACLTGGIGSAKTTLALYTTAYQLYLLSCLRSPQRLYGLDPSSEILFIFQSITKQLAEGVDYQRFRDMIQHSPYFTKYFPFDKGLESRMEFPNRISVVPVSGSATAAIGSNVFGGVIDELNYMAVVEKSKVSVDKGTYDQAIAVYNSISRRRKSRFMEAGNLPGILCLVSSKKYPGQFTDLKMEEAKRDKTIYVYDKCVWDIKPWAFKKGWFHVFTGDLARKPRVLEENESVRDEDRGLVVAVPLEFREEFNKDIINALREIAGVSTLARYPFFVEVDRIDEAFDKDRKSIFSQTTVDFVDARLVLDKSLFYRPDLPRFVHMDLAIRGDSAGLCIGTVVGFKEVMDGGSSVFLPQFHIDGTLEIRPPRNGEIIFSKIRKVLFTLRKMGLNLRWATLDQFQSTDTQQILRQQGMLTGQQSMDLTPCRPYDTLKGAFYDSRISLPEHLKLRKELLSLEKDPKTGKVDHPADGCFTGETRVALANGTCPTFKELVDRYKEGEEFYVYSMGKEGVRIAPAVNPRVTKHATELVEVLLDNYQVVRCTPEHLFMTLDGEWVQAQNLTPDVSIMPLYRSSSIKGGWSDYEKVWCPVRKCRVLTHHLAYKGDKGIGGHIHHKNDNKRDNSPDNLVWLTQQEHCRHHGVRRWDGVRSAMLRGHTEYYLDAVNREAQSNRLSALWASGKLGPLRGACSIEGCISPSNARGLCGAHYQKARRAKKLPERSSGKINHRVLSVTKVLVEGEPVYDLTVPDTHNFALASGVFVHNSKDVADALAGVVYGLTLRREIWAMYGVAPVNPSYLRDVTASKGPSEDSYQQEF
jgi:hypothetical protein